MRAADELDTIAQWVDCPRCSVSAGEQCHKPNGDRIGVSHLARRKAVKRTASTTR